jgi:tetratricopeptide (TPR) repeat protein
MKKSRVARFSVSLFLLCSFGFVSPRTHAQVVGGNTVDVRGQILLPDGNVPTSQIRLYFTRGDGSINDIRYTDSNGRFILERLNPQIGCSISVDSDEKTYGNSRYSFVPGYEQVVRFTLSPLPAKATASRPTVSAASAYKPDSKAANLYEQAMKEIKKKHRDEGERLLRDAIAVDPKYPEPLNDLGVVLMVKKKYSEAEKVLQQALEADPKYMHALLNLGITRNHLGKYEGAVEPLREATRLEPRVVAAHLHLGIALVETDQFEEGEKELDRAAKSPHADKGIVQLYRGKLYARTGDFDKSITAFNAYLDTSPESAQADEVRAIIARIEDLKAKRRH